MNDEQAPAPQPQPDNDPYSEVISPSDLRVYKVRASQKDRYIQAGYVSRHDDQEIRLPEIKKHFDGWMGVPEAAMVGTVGGVPFVNSAISKLSTAENAKLWAETVKAAEDEHPFAYLGGNMVGTGLAMAGATAAATAALPALGLGAAGAAAAGAAGTLGTIARGAKAANAVGKAAGAWTAAETLGGIALKGAASNMALGAVQRIDNAAIDHAFDPAGQEKFAFDLHDVMLDAALGGALPVGFKVGSNLLLKKLGGVIESTGLKSGKEAISKMYEVEGGKKQGLGDVDDAILKSLFEAGPKNAKQRARDMMRVTGDKMEQIKKELGRTRLETADRDALLTDVHKLVGNTPAWDRARAVIQDGDFDMAHLMKIRQQFYKQVVWTQYDQNPMYKAADLAGQRTTSALHQMLEKNDITTGGTRAQIQARLDKEYMGWGRMYKIVKNAQPDEIPQVLQSVAAKGVLGAAAGAAMSAVGLGSAVPGLGFGLGAAALEAARSLKGYHLAKAGYYIGQYMRHADTYVAKAVEAGLYGAPAQLHNIHSKKDYQEVAAKVAVASSDPVGSMTNMRTAFAEAGVPDVIAEDIVARNHAKLLYLATHLPKRSDASDIVTRSHGDPVQQNRFMGQVKTAQDPTYGILYPTRTNMEINKRFHPQTLYAAQQAVLAHVRKNPNLPSRTLAWASRITERPLGNLQSPRFSQMLHEARTKVAQEGQAQAKPSGKRGTSVQSEGGSGTRLDALQGGNA